MARSETFKLIILAKDAASREIRGVMSGVQKGRTALKEFNREARVGQGIASTLKRQILGLAGAYVGLSGIATAARTMREADQAAFNMAASVKAANREFDDLGGIRDWERTVEGLSDELKVYSDTALKNAISRTIDMTKRLGLSKDQMEEVIKRSADLGAGKTDLEGAIERVTAALRGEAESAEFLGLTLNENYVKSWAAANKVTEKAWKDLTDLEKAQVRYLAFLQQSDGMQGRAAESAGTFGGALQQINKEVTNAITRSKDVREAMQEVAKVLKENAEGIGDLAAMLVTGVGKVVSFTVEYRHFLAAIAGTAVAITLINKLTLAVKGLSAAYIAMTGVSILPWLASLRAALVAVATAATAAGTALRLGLAGAAAYSVVEIGRLIKVLWEWRKIVQENKALAKQEMENAQQYAWAKDVEVKSAKEFAAMSEQERSEYRETLKAALRHWGGMRTSLMRSGRDATEVEKKYRSLTDAIHKMLEPGKETVIVPPPTSLSPEELEKIAEDQKRLERELAEDMARISGDKWDVLLVQAKKHYDDQVALAHGNRELLAQIERNYKEQVDKINEGRVEERIKELEKIAEDQVRLDRELGEDQVGIAGDKWDMLLLQARQHYDDQVELAHGNRELLIQIYQNYADRVKKIFENLYELGGKKQKQWFYLAKAAALAEAIVNTAQAVTKALAQGGAWGKAQAMMIGAMGAVQIAKISAQSLAEGGLVRGTSPHRKADDKLIAVTSREYVQPVSAVEYYGLRVMEAIRQKLVPREVFSNFRLPALPTYQPAAAMAEGGAVVPSVTRTSSESIRVGPFYIQGSVDAKALARKLGVDVKELIIQELRDQVS